MNRKTTIIILSLISVLLVGLILAGIINYIITQGSTASDNKAIKAVVTEFSTDWYTYTTQNNKQYTEKLQPFMTSEFYNATAHVNLDRPQDFIGELSSKARLDDVTNIKIDGDNATTTVSIKQFEANSKTTKRRLAMSLKKVQGKWLVSDMTER